MQKLNREKVKHRLREESSSLTQIGKTVGVSRSYVSRVLSGSMQNRWADTRQRILEAIAEAIDVDVNQIDCTPRNESPTIKL